jgi:hypothetical protein
MEGLKPNALVAKLRSHWSGPARNQEVSSMEGLKPNALVNKLAREVLPPSAKQEGASALAGSNSTALRTYLGYLGERVAQGGLNWRVLYLDWGLRDCVFVEQEGIVSHETIKDPDAEFNDLDVIWVKDDTKVILGSGSQPAEAQLLKGDLTRAGDLDLGSIGGGTHAAATGVFCGARSPGCCYKTNR